MPRITRVDIADQIYHVINRANARVRIFDEDSDYKDFEDILEESVKKFDMRILAYCIMPNHFHLVLYPKKDGDLSLFMGWLTNTHTRRWHTKKNTIGHGHLYQGRYKSFLVDKVNYLSAIIKYVERNPVRAKLSSRCENWRWGSAWRRIHGTTEQKKLLDQKSFEIPDDYIKWINTKENDDLLTTIRTSVKKGVPYGREKWVDNMVLKYKLESTLRFQGRPRKNI